MILDKKSDQTYLVDINGDGLYLQPNNSIDGVLITKYGYMKLHILYERIRVDISKMVDFEMVENFSNLRYRQSIKSLMTNKSLYKHKTLDFYIYLTEEGVEEDFDEEDDFRPGEGYRRIYGIYYRSGEEKLDEIAEFLNSILEFEYESPSKASIILKTSSGFTLKEVPIKPMDIDLESMYNDDFIPVYEHMVDSLLNKNKGVVLLYGDAGTGKSNLIRHLTSLIPKKRFVFVPNTMIQALADPVFLSTLVENKNLILVLEDCENYLRDRKMSGDSSLVGTILNLTDGILSDVLGLQMICTFNSGLSDIDKALTRKGRLIDEYEFKPLTKDKALNLMSAIGVAEDEVDEYTLANIFNAKDNSTRIKKTKRSIGFGS